MNPIKIVILARSEKTPQEICSEFLDTSRWPEFKGYSILPGIKSAEFEVKTPTMIGSRIKVQNTDGTSHVEEIIEWDPTQKIAMKFQEFSPPLKHLASHFIETWSFSTSGNKTEAARSMAMYPKNFVGWLVLKPISRLMKKAFEENSQQLGNKKSI